LAIRARILGARRRLDRLPRKVGSFETTPARLGAPEARFRTPRPEIACRRGARLIGPGTVINPIIKVVTTVAILAAVYLFIVKPALDTTNTAFESFNDSFSGFGELPNQIQEQVDDAVGDTNLTRRLQDCIQRAISRGDSQRVAGATQRCVDRFGG
jgi:hypothetical protein